MALHPKDSFKDSCGFGLLAEVSAAPSHTLVQSALRALGRMTHRGAVAADGKSGDGCGILLQKPDTFFRQIAAEKAWPLADLYAVGMVFLGTEPGAAKSAEQALAKELANFQITIAGWRVVPTDESVCGEMALANKPLIKQVFVNAPEAMGQAEFDRCLFIARRTISHRLRAYPDYYICSLSSQTIIYKAMVMPNYLADFYLDLANPLLTSRIALFHQRFSTNTTPRWRLAQPFRYLAHNGEINTIQGNRYWASARESKFATQWLPDMSVISPMVNMTGSDSSSLDNMLEVLVHGGMDLTRAMRILIPPAWEQLELRDPDERAFYEYHAMHMEPWDGPAGIVLTDGRYAGCSLDRNGLRPARFWLSKKGTMVLGSEVGIFDMPAEEIALKGRLSPGELLMIDVEAGEIHWPDAIEAELKSRHPYQQWLKQYSLRIESQQKENYFVGVGLSQAELARYQKCFQVTLEERQQVLKVLAETAGEATGSMGDDTPLAVLSRQTRPLSDYFRQHFAQVTNPPIDPIREQVVMSLATYLGKQKNIFAELPLHAERLLLDSPILTADKMAKIKALASEQFAHEVIDLFFSEKEGLEQAINRLCQEVENKARAGKVLIILSDRNFSEKELPIPAVLAVGAIHHHLIGCGLRCDANLLVETATARDSHHFAVLIGFGANAVYPYLAFELLRDIINSPYLKQQQAVANYLQGIEKGLLKICSKMGIATINSYRAAQLFDIVGLADEITERCFCGAATIAGGLTFSNLQQQIKTLVQQAYKPQDAVSVGGQMRFVYGGEYHAFNPGVVLSLQQAVSSNRQEDYQCYADAVNNRLAMSVRDTLQLRLANQALPLEKIESTSDIFKRFDSAGMSLGALSPEVHEALAIAMNRLGGRSNSGEGGEDPSRYHDERLSKIKQIASGRFGVTAAYLVNAEVLQIKMAQGAKPGEGGQLPGAKVNELIATLRHAKPGITLISPPPHHDIYSIEDLAQLIYDLKAINPTALISVKLVANRGVGTIAAGVAKAGADMITVSGYDGGTGASPLSSIRYAGGPWEYGLREVEQALILNNLRDSVIVQIDGGLKTGLDVIKAAILGAESFGFGTAPLVALGCKYLRLCHLNNCATGVATQNELLRQQHYQGTPEKIINYFTFLAEEVRQWLAKLGYRSLTEIMGKTELLEINTTAEQACGLALNQLLENPYPRSKNTDDSIGCFNREFSTVLSEELLTDCLPAIINQKTINKNYLITNIDRAIGANLSGEIAKRYGEAGLASQSIQLDFVGSAGQSFAVWLSAGMRMCLEGDANDYVGKGMSGGEIILKPPAAMQAESERSVIMGNTCLYGATGGECYAAGSAGERFAIRNSGALAVVEGVGNHGCEYMTGGVVVILGSTGYNFGAGMTGGLAYVLDEERQFVDNYNHQLIGIHRIHTSNMKRYRYHLEEILQKFVVETASPWGEHVQQNFEQMLRNFWLVKPIVQSL